MEKRIKILFSDGDRMAFYCSSTRFIWIVFLVICSMPALINNANIVEFIGKGIISAFMSFGGGDAYLTIADGLFVDTNMVTESQFYGHIVSVVNVLPGSILCKT